MEFSGWNLKFTEEMQQYSQQPQVDILSLESQKSFGDELAPNRGG